jgi:aconitate hydratase
LALTFANKEDYNKIREDDMIDLVGLTSFSPDRPLTLALTHNDGTKENITVNHSYNAGQILWFKGGSALNVMGGKEPITTKATTKAHVKKVAPKKAAKKAAKKVAPKAKAKKVVRKAPKKAAPKSKAAKKRVVKKVVAKKKAVKKSVKKKK